MPSHSKHGLYLLSFFTAFVVLSSFPPLCPGLETQKTDSVKRETDRAENFLLRTYEQLNKSLEYESAAIESLEKQYSARRDAGMKPFLEWHRSYAAWLRDRITDTESDLEIFYSGKARRVRANRYPAMAEDYDRLKGQLNNLMQSLDQASGLNAAKIRKLSAIIDYREYMAEQAEKKRMAGEKWKPDRKPPEDWLLYAKDLDDEKVKRMLDEISLLQDMQTAIGFLRDLERSEAEWIGLKSGDSEALSAIADAVMDYSPERFEEATDSVIKRYESDVSVLEKNLRETDGRRTGLGRSDLGSIDTLDRNRAYADYYFIVKTRLEHHLQWLREQIGGCRADIVLLAKERKR